MLQNLQRVNPGHGEMACTQVQALTRCNFFLEMLIENWSPDLPMMWWIANFRVLTPAMPTKSHKCSTQLRSGRADVSRGLPRL